MNDETVEIDSKKLSEDIREDLQEELDVNDDIIDEKAKNIRLKSIDLGDPNKQSSIVTIKKYIQDRVSSFQNITDYNSVYGTIDSLEPERNKIQMNIKHKNSIDSLYFDNESTEIANFMEYKNADNILELKGEQIPGKCEEFGNKKQYLIPKRISFIDNLQYKIHNRMLQTHDILDKIMNNERFDNSIFGLMVMWLVSNIFLIYGMRIPFIISSILLVFIFGVVATCILTSYVHNTLDNKLYKK